MDGRLGRACLAVASLLACEAKPRVEEAPWVAPFGQEARTGFADCDAVIVAYKPCIDAKAPAIVRDDVRMGLEKTIAYWLEFSASPSGNRRAGKNGLTHLCREALERWIKTAAALGCDPPELGG